MSGPLFINGRFTTLAPRKPRAEAVLVRDGRFRAVGYTKDTPNPPGGEIVRDSRGNPTGMLVAKPNVNILYATLAKGQKLSPEATSWNGTRRCGSIPGEAFGPRRTWKREAGSRPPAVVRIVGRCRLTET